MFHKVKMFIFIRINILTLILSLLLCTSGCIFNNIEKSMKEDILKNRVDAMYTLWQEGNIVSRYDFLWPELRKVIEYDYFISTGPYIQKIEDYKIESINIEDGIGMVVIKIYFISKKEPKEIKWFTFWGYHGGNWYVIDDLRSMPYHKVETERFKKMVKEGIPAKTLESIMQNQTDWKEAQKKKR